MSAVAAEPIEVAGLEVASAVFLASGCGGTGRELASYVDLAELGGFVTRTLTLNPRAGGPTPRIQETPSGLLNAIGLHNPGVDQFLALEMPWLARQGTRIVVSVAAANLGEYAELTRRISRAPGVSAIELNLSVPDPLGLGVFDVREPFHAAHVVTAVQRDLPRGMPLFAKLRPEPHRVVETARCVLDAGASAVVVGNSVVAAMPDGRVAGLSGPAIRAIALRCVTDVCAALPEATVVAAGGISSAADARAFLAVGARAVQIGTAQLHDPTTAARVVADLRGAP